MRELSWTGRLSPPQNAGLDLGSHPPSVHVAHAALRIDGLAPPRDCNERVGDHVLAFAAPLGAVRSTADSEGDPRRLHRSVRYRV